MATSMIQFSCHCGHRFSVAQKQAGGVIQCPQCHKLNDVPLLSDLAHIDPDGTYKLDTAPRLKDDPQRIAKLTRVFTREHFDSQGNPIDLRQTAQPREPAGQIPLVPLQRENNPTPKYDPVTGELVRELPVSRQTDPDPDSLPVARLAPPKQRSMVDGIDMPHPLEALAIPLRLLRPANLVVMFFILLAHGLGQMMTVAMAGGYLILLPFWPVLHGLILSHFGNVIDETGPASRSELPTPLRSLSWEDDTWGPFWRMAGAFVYCYGPAIAVLLYIGNLPSPAVLSGSAILAVVGTILFPAAAMTVITSGSIVNLRPDRVVGTALVCGVEYALALLLWIAGGGLWLAGAAGINLIAWDLMRPADDVLPPHLNAALAYGMLAAGLYLMHFLCWHLGTLYRKHREQFPWAYQRHIHKNRPTPPGAFPVARPRQ